MIPSIQQDYIIQPSKIEKKEEIARGGFGIVYKGLMQGFNEVAIKELHNQSITQVAKQQLEQEIAIAKQMRHPNIVLFYGYCQKPLQLIMEYLPNNLFNKLHDGKDFPWQQRRKISLEIVLGLQYIHEKNIVHRDLKSDNILLDKDLKVKITDFGLSRIRTESKPIESSQQVGNIRWMAPELMCLNPEYSKFSDIFALGVIFWEIATRKIPYQDTDNEFIKEGIKEGGRENIPENCPLDYRTLIEGC